MPITYRVTSNGQNTCTCVDELLYSKNNFKKPFSNINIFWRCFCNISSSDCFRFIRKSIISVTTSQIWLEGGKLFIFVEISISYFFIDGLANSTTGHESQILGKEKWYQWCQAQHIVKLCFDFDDSALFAMWSNTSCYSFTSSGPTWYVWFKFKCVQSSFLLQGAKIYEWK